MTHRQFSEFRTHSCYWNATSFLEIRNASLNLKTCENVNWISCRHCQARRNLQVQVLLGGHATGSITTKTKDPPTKFGFKSKFGHLNFDEIRTTFQIQFSHLGSDLVSALAGLNVDDLPHVGFRTFVKWTSLKNSNRENLSFSPNFRDFFGFPLAPWLLNVHFNTESSEVRILKQRAYAIFCAQGK